MDENPIDALRYIEQSENAKNRGRPPGAEAPPWLTEKLQPFFDHPEPLDPFAPVSLPEEPEHVDR